MEKIKQHRLSIIIAVVILVCAGAFLWGRFGYSNNGSRLPFAFAKVVKGDFVRDLSLTGTVKPAEEIKLSFERSGKVDQVYIKAGDKIKAGQVLADLTKIDASADYLSAVAAWQMAKSQVDQTQAAYQMQVLKKQDILNGAKNEDVNVSETQVSTAEKNLTDSQTNQANVKAKADADLASLDSKLSDLLADADNKAHDTIYLTANSMFTDPDSINPRLTFSTPLDSQSGLAAEEARIKVGQAYKNLRNDIQSLKSDYSNSADVFAKIDTDLGTIKDFLNSLNVALSNTSVSSAFPQSTLSAYQSSVSGAITAINGSISALDALNQSMILQNKTNQNLIFAAQTQVDQAQSALSIADSQLDLKKSSATTDQIAIQDAAIKQAQAGLAAQNAQLTAASANLAKAKAQLDKTTIKSPIDGIIASVDLDPGEAITANVPVITLQSAGKFQAETFLPELYLGEVQAGNQAAITFDAYGAGKIFAAKVISIDPAAKVGVTDPVYRTLLEFNQEDAAIKSGLTANIKIVITSEKDVLTIPESAVIKNGEKNFVLVDNGTKTGEKREVVIGKSGQGRVPVQSGLSEGESVADFGSAISGN